MNKTKEIKELMDLLSGAPSENARMELLELLLTPNEVEQLIARYEIIKGLTENNMTQRELSKMLKLSIAKITRGSNELKRRSSLLKTYLAQFFTHKEY